MEEETTNGLKNYVIFAPVISRIIGKRHVFVRITQTSKR